MTDKLIIQQLQQDLSYYPYDSETSEVIRAEILRLKTKNYEQNK